MDRVRCDKLFGFPRNIGLDRGQKAEELFGNSLISHLSSPAVPSRIIVRVIGLRASGSGLLVDKSSGSGYK